MPGETASVLVAEPPEPPEVAVPEPQAPPAPAPIAVKVTDATPSGTVKGWASPVPSKVSEHWPEEQMGGAEVTVTA